MFSLSTSIRCVGGVLLFAAAYAAQAVPLNIPVGATYEADTALPGTTLVANPYLAGTVLADVLTSFSFDGVDGTVQNRVVQETGTGTLDFYWKVNVNSDSTGMPLSALRIGDFGAANITDANWRIDGLGTQAPDTAVVFNDADVPGGFVNFMFNNAPIAAGTSSTFFYLHTTATAYAETAEYDLVSGPNETAGNISGLYSTFAPVPEPSTLALALAGMALVARVATRRRAA